jgi:hypothetical protein
MLFFDSFHLFVAATAAAASRPWALIQSDFSISKVYEKKVIFSET